MDGRHLVTEEVLRGRELALRLGEVALTRVHQSHAGGGVAPTPAGAPPDRAHQRFRRGGVEPRRFHLSALGRDQRECRPGERVAGRPAGGVRMLDRSQRCGPGLIGLTGQIERASVATQRRHESGIGFDLGDRHRAATLANRLPDIGVHAPSLRRPARTG